MAEMSMKQENYSIMVTQCLDFFRQLASQVKDFSISLKLGLLLLLGHHGEE